MVILPNVLALDVKVNQSKQSILDLRGKYSTLNDDAC